MNISNEFVTVEFNTEKEKAVARRCMKLIESQKDLYKNLLNGNNLISCGDICNMFADYEKNCKDVSDIRFKHFVDTYIEQENYAKSLCMIPEYKPGRLYDAIVYVLRRNLDTELEGDLFLDLASNYYYLTKDFSYLKKFIYHGKKDKEDIKDMVITLVDEYYSVLLREKISLDLYIFTEFLKDHNTSTGLVSILNELYEATAEKAELISEYLDKEDNEGLLPSISDEEFEELVKGALSYIDPSNSLLEEYIKCKKEGRICDDSSSYFYCNPEDSNDYEIGLCREGNIQDVIVLVHEFAHLHYSMIDFEKRDNIGGFIEYPAIYYELKAAEYLCSKGYSEKEIEDAKMFRIINNFEIGNYLPSEVNCIYDNQDEDKNRYDLSWLKTSLDEDEGVESWLKEIYPDESEDEIKEIMKDIEMQTRLKMLLPLKDYWKTVPYIIGTFFAKEAIEYYENEEVLEMLEKIQLNECDLYDVLDMHDFEPESIGMTKEKEEPKQKAYKL